MPTSLPAGKDRGGDRGWGFDQLTEGFEVDPVNSNELAFTGLGFLHLSTNGGQTWQQAYEPSNAEPSRRQYAATPCVPGHRSRRHQYLVSELG